MTYAANFDCTIGVFAERSTYSEIYYLQILLLFPKEHDVFGFEVPVHNAVCMTVVYSRKDLLHIQAGLLLCEASLFYYTVKKLSSLAVVHDYVEILALIVDIIKADDVRVVLPHQIGTRRFRIIISSKC